MKSSTSVVELVMLLCSQVGNPHLASLFTDLTPRQSSESAFVFVF